MTENNSLMKKATALLTAFAVMALCFVGVIPVEGKVKAAASDITLEEALQWINNKADTQWAVDVDGVYGVQCVDLIMAYYEFLGYNRVGGNASAYATEAYVLQDGWYRDDTPSPGAIIAWPGDVDTQKGTTSSDYHTDSVGHVGIVVAIDGEYVHTVETNYAGFQYARKITNRKPINAKYIHPNFKTDGSTPPPYPDYEYVVMSDGAVAIAKYTGSGEKIEIPSTIYGKPVTIIGGSAFYDCTTLTEVVIPNSVTIIQDFAFYNCTSLAKIVIPSSVTEIGSFVFWNCASLTEATIPNSVTEIGRSMFFDCTSLAKVVIPNSVTKISESAFYNCTSLNEIAIPNGVTEIGESAFNNCTSLTKITIPNSVTKIGRIAFDDCTSLAEIVIPNGVTKIDEGTFAYCTSLAKVVIPNGVTEIDDMAFAHCKALDNVEIPDSVTKIGDQAFEVCTSLSKITIPYKVTEIGRMAFAQCESLTEVVISGNVTKMGSYAFAWCYALKSVKILGGTTKIGGAAFYLCEALTDIEISNGVTEIGEEAFHGTALTEVVIPDSVTKIGKKAFSFCKSLVSFKIPASVTSIGEDAFYHCWYLTFYGYTGSYAETYAEQNNIKFVPITDLTDNTTNITVTAEESAVPSDTKLVVEQTNQTNTSVSYNITLTSSGKEIQPNGAVTVSIPVPAGWNSDDINVYHRDGSGRLTNMNAVVSGSSVVFTTDHFSEYIITTEKLVTTIRGDVNNSGGDPNNDDLIALAQYLANWTIEINMEAANVDGDAEGKVNNDDLIMLAQLLAGWKV